MQSPARRLRLTPGERRMHRVWDGLYARGVNLTANCRGVLAAPVLTELGFEDVRREYISQCGFPNEVVSARKADDQTLFHAKEARLG